MILKLDKAGFGIYEKYRGFSLTAKGEKIAEGLVEKNEMLVGFLRTIGVHEKNIDLEVEGIEHCISKQTALCISSLVSFFEENHHIMEFIIQYQKQSKDKGLEHIDRGNSL